MISELVVIAVVGKLGIFLVGQLLSTAQFRMEFLKKLFHCDLCLGVYCFFFLCGIYRIEVISEFTGIYIPIVNEVLTGASMSFIVHLISLGWKIKFSEFTVVE